MDLEFNNVTYTVVRRNFKFKVIPKLVTERLEILHSVSGKFHSGQLSAIMGPSGAGKTCLLNALSGYRSAGVQGEFLVGGRARDNRDFHKWSSFITHEDLLQPLLTVSELMNLVASLKLPSSCSADDRRSTVAGILRKLRMNKQNDTRTEDLSGGEKKRLSIAMELVNNPPIFFLDEPTSGLDQVTTVQCVKLLRMLAKQGRNVIVTIHQPSASILEMFDQVYVVSQGSCVYNGSTDALVPFLSKVGLPCPRYFNPADFVIELTENSANVKELCDAARNGKSYQTVSESIENAVEADESLKDDLQLKRKKSNCSTISQVSTISKSMAWIKMNRDFDTENEYASSGLVQFKVLLQRMMTQIIRNTTGIIVQLILHISCGLLIGSAFNQTANDGSKIFNSISCFLLVVCFFAYNQVMSPVLAYPPETKLIKNEYFNRWYGLVPYYAAMTISKLPLQIPLNTLFCTIVYFMVGLPPEFFRYVMFCINCNIISFVAESFGLAVGSVFNAFNGSAVGSMMNGSFLAVAMYGFDLGNKMPKLMQLAVKTSFVRCGYITLVLTAFGLDRQPVPCDDIYCHLGQPKVLLKYLNFEELSVWHQMGELMLTAVFYRTLSYLGLWYRFAKLSS